jgi:DNA-binding response OmpR family regulator
MIPKLNGFDLCRIVKKEKNMTDIYIILLTAKGQVNDRAAGYDAGANAYITKPFNPDELLALTEQVIEA